MPDMDRPAGWPYWGRILKHHPECKCFFGNACFDDPKQDWAEVCDALAQPIRVSAEEISLTKRNRAYGTSIGVPGDCRDGLRPMGAATYMDPGRTGRTYLAYGKDCVRSLGASWLDGSDGQSIDNTGKPLMVTDLTRMRLRTLDPMKPKHVCEWNQRPLKVLEEPPRID